MSRPARPTQRSPWAGPLGLYRPGTTVLHRARPGAKLGGLATLGALVVVLRGPGSAAALLVAVLGAAAIGRLPLWSTVRSTLPVLLTATLLGGYQWWARGWQVGAEVAVDLVTLVLAATVVTATTPADRMLDALGTAARPLRHVGLPPETVALAVGIMLRAIPALLETFTETRDAARARGLDRSPRALLVPAAVRTVARARATGDALAARGLAD
ncbi:energy-coupling factor transporter transmembrane protein EcfT (plasmid) [Cellulomonas sp. WB94]|uniref:energy-coupling factor transporter transmembrane component T family protein n=1 Tax=Cellulomonas sp. WB94 TaxID=2173174 RepID=UPI000D566393|nr:energy-coupling factor transporter transmembrane protein EcfT [Cellulomonas sp. WB94]PVU81241.1 energy-coupling factor transporter transmembrane protein EcfT [Cellulomonas sp. WB94]